jgi:heptosyltransferase-2
MRILIVKLGAIGDVLRTTSLLSGLREKYHPEAIDWITSSSGKDILLYNPLIRQVFTWEERKELGPYDLVIGLEDDLEACQLVSRVSSQKVIGAFAEDGKIAYTPSAWFDMSAISKYGLKIANQLKQKNNKTFQQHMADLLGIKVGSYIFKLTGEEIEYGKNFLRDLGLGTRDKIIGINTGAGKRWQLKSFGIEKTIDLVKRLKSELGLVSLILGGAEEKERNEIIAKETGMPNGGLHSLRNFAGVINQCRWAVTSDSLAMHFAIALRKKTAVFFGPTSPAEIELYGLGVKVYPNLDCLVCYNKKCDKKPNCMDRLSVEDLFEGVKTLI